VELLVVITIIGMLAGMISVVAIRVRRTAKNAVMKVEVSSLDQALNAFKEKFGTYPPDATANINQFLAVAFPRYSGGWPPNLPGTDPSWSSVSLTPSTALTIWLGGATGNGFSANPLNPFDDNPTRIGPFFTFDMSRVVASAYTYFPNNGLGTSTTTNSPYVYFCAQNGTYSSSSSCTFTTSSTTSTCKPYIDTRLGSGVYANATTFQILCPGQDGTYGSGVSYPYGSDYTLPQQLDDITNFSTSTLGNDQPN
jgi:type II secretory pathway pseudopilin PulG